MKHMDYLDLDAADLQRIDEIITLRTGQTLAAETASWRRRRNRFWMAILLVLLLLMVAGVLLVQWWA